MRTHLITLVVALVAGLATTGCYYRARGTLSTTYRAPSYVVVSSEPPPLQAAVTVRPNKPDPNALWVSGHWKWEGRWVWEVGHWTTPPQTNYVWTPPVVVRVGGGYRYHPGHWRPHGARVSTVYTQPSAARVSVEPAHVVVQGSVSTRPQPGTVSVPQHQQSTQPGTVTGSTGGTVQTQPGTVTVTGGAGGTVQTRPGTVSAGGTIQTRPGNVQTGTSVVAPGGSVVTRPGGTTVVTPGGTVSTRPGNVVVNQPAGTPTVSAGGTIQAGAGQTNLRCTMNTARAPRGGLITLNGNGFGNNTAVLIGGNTAAVVNRTGSQLRVQVPRNSSGGMVTVRAGNRSANCGNLLISGG